jgi:two-component system KDP operon response regulator KdpE
MARERSVLVVDSDIAIRRYLRRGLRAEGYLVDELASPESAPQCVVRTNCDVVILDVDSAPPRGTDSIRAIRDVSSVPVIVMSSRGGEKAAVDALKSGADDFVRKPFSLGETLARVESVLRRMMRQSGEAPTFIAGDLEVDLMGHRVWSRKREVHLAPRQFEVLRVLIGRAGQVVPYDEILSSSWGSPDLSKIPYLRIAIEKLRATIEEVPSRPAIILTEPRIGYRLFMKHTRRRPGSAA